MTLDFYDLKEEPFGFLPDTRFLYLSSTHRQALASLLLALKAGRGYVTLLAQPGLGKTTLLFHTLHSLGDKVATVYLFQAPRTPVDLLRAVLMDLGVHQIDENVEGMFFQLRELLLETHRLGKRVVIVIDEAQNLDASVFDLLCTLSNLATLGAKLIQFILCGKPVLSDKLAAIRSVQSMEHGVAAHLEPFSDQDTAQYLDHRLRTAGYGRQSPLFTPEAAALVARYSRGTPRTINHLCFEALSTAYRYRREQIEADTVHEAAATLDLTQAKPKTIVGSALPPPVATHVSVIETSRPVPQPAKLALTSRTDRAPSLPAWPAAAAGTPGKRKGQQEKPLSAAPKQPASPPVKTKKKAVRAPAGHPSARPALLTKPSKEKNVAGSQSQPATRSRIAAKKEVIGPVLTRTAAKVQQAIKRLPEKSALSLPKRAVIREKFVRLKASALQARSSRIAVRPLVSRPLSGLTIAAVLLLTITGAVFGTYRAETVHPAAKQTVAASPLPHISGPVAQRDQAPPILAIEPKAAPAATPQDAIAAQDSSAQIHDLKGMDLQSALRALSTRKQRNKLRKG